MYFDFKWGGKMFNKELVKEKMKEQGHSLESIAYALTNAGAPITKMGVASWFRAKNCGEPREKTKILLAKILNISLAELSGYTINDTTNSAPFYNVDVFEMVAGFGTEGYLDPNFAVSAQIALPSEFLGNISPKFVRIIRCLGDSMEPDFCDGDYMMIEMLANRHYIKRAGIYLVRLDNIIYIKRVEFLPNNDIKLISINPNYPAFTASSTGYEWEILACVFGRISVKIGSGFQFDTQGIK